MRKRILAALALMALLPALAVSQTYSLTSSPTNEATAALFTEVSDQYLDVLLYGKVLNPVFMLKLGSTSTSVSEPYEIGLSGRVGVFYVGGYYAFNAVTTGLLAGGDSVVQTNDDTLIMSADGTTIVGKTGTAQNAVGYRSSVYQKPVIFFGMNLGDLQLGAKNSFTWDDSTERGTYAAVAAGTSSTSQVTTVSEISGTEYAPTYIDSMVYDEGVKSDLRWTELLELGASLPFGPMVLSATVDLGFSGAEQGSRFADLHSVMNTAPGYPEFTPSLGLPGEDLAAQADIQSWVARRYDDVDSSFSLEPGLSASVEYPFSCFGSPAVATAGISYSGEYAIHAATLEDETGADLKASTGSFSHSLTYGATAAGATFSTSTVEDRSYDAFSGMVDSINLIGLPLSMVVTPGPAVRFAVGLSPSVEFGLYSYDYSGESLTRTVLDDGDGIDADADPDDTTTVVAVTEQPYSQTTNDFELDFDASAGVQIFLKPEVVRLNLGVGASLNALDRQTITRRYTGMYQSVTTVTSAGVDTVTDSTVTLPSVNEYSKTVDESGIGASCSYEAGITWFLNPSVTFDFVVANPAALNLADTSATGGFFDLTNWSIQMTINLPPQAAPAGSVESEEE